MYAEAKKARMALKSKAQRLGNAKNQKVDSSTWTPPEELNADVKTGLRPISRRAFKKGGKVMGEACEARADRKPRKAGGKTEAVAIANAKVNRNVKSANEEREGKKHIGGMKKGGRAKKQEGGELTIEKIIESDKSVPAPATQAPKGKPMPVSAAQAQRMNQQMQDNARQQAMENAFEDERRRAMPRKSGGRTKKAMGGPDTGMYGPGVAGAAEMMKKAGRAGVPAGMMSFGRTTRGALSPAKAVGIGGMKKGGSAKSEDYLNIRNKAGTQVAAGMKKGGMTKHSDEAQDRALFKKMEKEEHKKEGHEDEAMDKALIRKMVKPSARTARKDGGRTKGKTNINIVIAAGKPAGSQDMMGKPPTGIPTDNRGAGGIPVPVSQPPGGMPGMPGGGMPMPMPIPMPPAGGPPAPQGGMPMARKSGGRVSKVASSYKDMEAGAGSGEGRLQKTDIAKKQPKPGFQKGVNNYTGISYPNKVPGATGGRTARKDGGKAYRSYKDMDAGAGSGVGRLEKTEIASRKK